MTMAIIRAGVTIIIIAVGKKILTLTRSERRQAAIQLIISHLSKLVTEVNQKSQRGCNLKQGG